jgi:hypothetical protein
VIGDEDLTAIFESGDFDTAATFTISTTATLDVQGWFTDATEQTNILSNEVEAVMPMFDCASSELEQAGSVVRKGMAVSIDDTAYTIERISKLGTGVTTIYLKT